MCGACAGETYTHETDWGGAFTLSYINEGGRQLCATFEHRCTRPAVILRVLDVVCAALAGHHPPRALGGCTWGHLEAAGVPTLVVRWQERGVRCSERDGEWRCAA